jgi:hypothetical protein
MTRRERRLDRVAASADSIMSVCQMLASKRADAALIVSEQGRAGWHRVRRGHCAQRRGW